MYQKSVQYKQKLKEFHNSVKSVIKKTKHKMDYKVCKFRNGIILEDNLKS